MQGERERTAPMTRLSDDLADVPDKWLADADRELRELYPGDPGTRQPVHTVYIPADRFSPDAHRRWGTQAVELLDRHAPTAERLAEVTGMPVPLVYDVYDRFGPNSSASRWKTCEWTSRTATASAPTRRRTGRQARWPLHSPQPPGPRTARPSSNPLQELRGADPPARPPNPRPRRHRAPRLRWPSGGVRGDAAEGDLDGPGRGHG